MPECVVNGVTYFYTLDGSGTPLLLLHGFTGSSQNWQPFLPVFTEQFQVIAVDILGHGRSHSPSDSTRYQMDHVAADLLALLDTLGVSQCALLGYSMGGRLALYTAVHHPHRFTHLILESASPGLETAQERADRRARDDALADRIERDGIARFVDYWEALPLWVSQEQLSPTQRAALRAQRLHNNPMGLAHSLRGMGTGVQSSLWPLLNQLTLPVLLLAGELDEKFVRIHRLMHRLLLNSQLEVVAGAGHTVHMERPLSFQQLVLDFLAM